MVVGHPRNTTEGERERLPFKLRSRSTRSILNLYSHTQNADSGVPGGPGQARVPSLQKTPGLLLISTTNTRMASLTTRLFLATAVTTVATLDLDHCKLLPHIMAGAPQVGIPGLDPLLTGQLDLANGTGTTLQADFVVWDSRLTGLSSANVTSLKMGAQGGEQVEAVMGVVFLRPLILSGHYRCYGTLRALQLTGQGFANITLYNTTSTVHLKGYQVKYPRDSRIYVHLCNLSLTLEPSLVHLQLGRLDGGTNDEISRGLNWVLNRHWRDVLADLSPKLHSQLGSVLLDVARRLLLLAPVSELFS